VESLTPQELQTALTVAAGATNREAAAALFLSEKTIEMHLSRVYRKLGVRSRTELARLLPQTSHDHDASDISRPSAELPRVPGTSWQLPYGHPGYAG
jgi:DNA-binding CsgD family transcriptional regulator